MKKRFIITVIALAAALVMAAPAPLVRLGASVTAKADVTDMYTVSVPKGYLALRSAKAFDAANEIGKLYSGDTVQVLDTSDATYWYVYSTKHDKYGYVNQKYLLGSKSVSGKSYKVKVDDGYLALRTAMAFDAANEIGKLYTGDSVTVQDTSNDTYWYVYSPKLNKYGYVNRNYLVGAEKKKVDPPKNPIATYEVSVSDGYLALRTAKAFDYNNEIGKLWTGDSFQVTDDSDDTYWYGYAPSLGKYGYVNRNYLLGAYEEPDYVIGTYTVSVSDGYLALRTAKAFDYNNEIGKLWTGDTVQVTDNSDDTYWWVYAPSLGKSGYVNRNYLVGAGSSSSYSGWTMTVSVSDGYLALRTAKAFDYNNEIGKLWSGDKVEVQDSSDSTYWWVYAPSLGKSGYVNKNYLY